MKKLKKLGALSVDTAIIAIAAALYFCLMSPAAVMTAAGSRRSPVMRCASENEVSLLFSVSWDAAALGGILDVLKDEGVKATFAVSGEWAEDNSGMLKRMREEGHEIATLGYDPFSDGGAAFLKDDLERSLNAISRAAGEVPVIYCCGTRSADASARAGAKAGLTTVIPTVDLDCGGSAAGEILKKVGSAASGGSIIGLQPTRSLEEALPFLIEKIKNMGFDIVPTHKMLYNHTDKV